MTPRAFNFAMDSNRGSMLATSASFAKNQHVIGSSFIGPDRFFIEAAQEFVRNRNFVRFVGRKVQRQAVRFFAHLQFPAPGRVETDRGFSPIFVFEQDVGRRQRGVAAQVFGVNHLISYRSPRPT